MSALDWFIDPRFLSGIGLGFLITTYGILTLLGNSNNPANSLPKLKLSSKKLPSITELKSAYQKQCLKPKLDQKQTINSQVQNEQGRCDNKNKFAKKQNTNDYEEVIRKKVKMQYHQFDPLFEENRSQKSFSNFESIDSSPQTENQVNQFQQEQQNQQIEPDLEEIIDFAETSSKLKNENGRKKVNVELFPNKQIQKNEQAILEEEIIE